VGGAPKVKAAGACPPERAIARIAIVTTRTVIIIIIIIIIIIGIKEDCSCV
jgi:hypothetical protein